MFKTFTVKCIERIIKDKISAIVSNWKCSIANFKICPDTIQDIFILIIDNKYIKSVLILQFLFTTLIESINVCSHLFCKKI